MTHVMDLGFCICSNFKNYYPQYIFFWIVGRSVQFHNDVFLHHPRKYRRSITMDMKILICEPLETISAAMERAPFATKCLEQVMNFKLSVYIHHEILE